MILWIDWAVMDECIHRSQEINPSLTCYEALPMCNQLTIGKYQKMLVQSWTITPLTISYKGEGILFSSRFPWHKYSKQTSEFIIEINIWSSRELLTENRQVEYSAIITQQPRRQYPKLISSLRSFDPEKWAKTPVCSRWLIHTIHSTFLQNVPINRQDHQGLLTRKMTPHWVLHTNWPALWLVIALANS